MKVTVFMPVYNAEKYLKESIESILNQTYTDYELLIINDGSVDNSEKIINKYLSDPRIKYVKNEKNMGLPYTRNRGLELSNGKYIAMMDSDDIALPNRLEEQVKYLNQNDDVGVVGADYFELRPNKLRKNMTIHENEKIKIHLMFLNCICNPVSMIRKSVVMENNISYREECFVAQDYAFWVDCSNVTKIHNIDKMLLKYRIGHENITKKSMDKKAEQRKEVIGSIRSRALNNNGFVLSKDKLDCLNYVLYDGNTNAGYEYINKFKSVLNELVQYNKDKGIFSEENFRYVVQEIWSNVIIKNDLPGLHKLNLLFTNRFYHFNQNDMRKVVSILKKTVCKK